MDTNDPIIQLCMQGAQAEFEGSLEAARSFYQQAWKISQNDYQAYIAAHYLARFQGTPKETLRWNPKALERANRMNDERVKEFYLSLYLNFGRSHEMPGNQTGAQRYYNLTAQLAAVHQPE